MGQFLGIKTKPLKNHVIFVFSSNSALSTSLPEKLYAAFQNEVGQNGLNITDFLSGWVQQPGYPVLNVNVSSDRQSVTITQRRFLRNNPDHQDDTLWHIPITYASDKQNTDFSATKASVYLTHFNESLQIELGEAIQWIVFNVQQTGKCVRHGHNLSCRDNYLNGYDKQMYGEMTLSIWR